MTWIKIEDTLPDHIKIMPLPDATRWLYVEALCYAHRNRTDGFVPTQLVGRARTKAANQLVTARLWIPDPERDGWLIHGYLDWYPSRAIQEDRIKRAAEAGRKGAAKRWGNPNGVAIGQP